MSWRALLLALCCAGWAAPGVAEEAPAPEAVASAAVPAVYDPWEGYNRAIFGFNMAVDRAIVRPFARGYRDTLPLPVRDGISRFLDNLENPLNIFNNLLQGKPLRAGNDLLRLVINTTLGIGGFLDPATSLGLTQSDEDFGQTLGRWGVGTGPYLMLPFFPPKTLRDAAGEFPDSRLDPFTYAEDEWTRYAGKTFDYLELRYRVLELDPLIDEAYDPYVFVRNAYLERRGYKIRDGAPLPDDGGGDDLYEDPADAEDAPPAPPTEAEPTPAPAEPPPY